MSHWLPDTYSYSLDPVRPYAHFLDLPEKEREQDDVFSKYMYNFPNNVDIQENVWCFCRH